MIHAFRVNRYDEFIGDIPPDILRLVPHEERTTFWREVRKNAAGKIVVGWKVSDNGLPFPILAGFEFKTGGTW